MPEILVGPHAALEDRQPKALASLFMTELWERFSYWSLYSLLVLYMVHHLHMSDARAYVVFASFNALLYASPIVGGWLADRYLTQKYAIIQGAVWLVLGYALLGMAQSQHAVYLALGVLIWGNGLFKPNIGAQLGSCYEEGDSRRQRGFTIYYMGINIGATIGVLGCGWVAKTYGWSAAFSIVAVAMGVGLVTYLLKLSVIEKDIKHKATGSPSIKSHITILVLGAVLVVPLGLLLSAILYANAALVTTVVALAMYLFVTALRLKKHERNRMLLCLLLTIASVAFWALYMQMGTSLTLYVQRCTNLTVGHITLGASMVSSANGIWLLLLSPVFISLWGWLNKKGLEPKTDVKFVLGMLFMTLGYAVLAVSAWCLVPGTKSNLSWVVSSYGLQTLGELCLSPIGLAMVTELAPKNCKSLMMGVWFLATAIASTLSGQLAKIAAIPKNLASHHHISTIYAHAFAVDTLIGLLTMLALLSMIPYLRKLA